MITRSPADQFVLALNRIQGALNQINGPYGMEKKIHMPKAKHETMPNSLIREHFSSSGEPKVRRSREDAEEYAADHGLVAYRCTFCDYFHVGTE